MKIDSVRGIDCAFPMRRHQSGLKWEQVRAGEGEVISLDVFLIGRGDVKWMIMLRSPRSEAVVAAEGLMYDPALIECADFDWFFRPASRGRSVLYPEPQTLGAASGIRNTASVILPAE